MNIWHSEDISVACEKLGTSPQGLSAAEVRARMNQYGPNELIQKKKKPAWLMFLLQFSDFMIVILVIAALISGMLGDLVDTIIILVIVFLNAVVGFIQEYRAEKAMEALQKMAALHCRVIRDGVEQNIRGQDLVPGDIVLLEAGNAVPADLRLTEVHTLRIDESALTGESVPVDKTTKTITSADVLIADRTNIAYKGTNVTNGRGKGVVVATGMNTEFGRIASLLQSDELQTPLQKRMADFGRKLSYLILVICAVLFMVGLLRGEEPLQMALLSISLAVAAIPEALPALITIALARGASRLVKQNALIRKLPAVETLGSVTYICSDKTGTLTLNRMRVEQTLSGEERLPGFTVSPFLMGLALNNDVKFPENGKPVGDPTEIALVELMIRTGGQELYNNLLSKFPRTGELPFDSDRKCMSTLHDFNGKVLVLTKGATESIVSALVAGESPDTIMAQSAEWAKRGLRVLALGYKVLEELPAELTIEQIEKDLRFAGLAGMIDPPRDEVRQAIMDCHTAGITPVMITGDHPATANAIAGNLGILTETKHSITGRELQQMSDRELEESVERIGVYSRVSPEQKLRIVKALQSRRHFVAMTGDGVNDAPSLRSADIGVAMGITGTDVSKEAAHMILLDDNFATIVKAVKEGRRIYDNIRKFVKYIMTCNSAEIWTIFMAPLAGLPIPLLPIHILWINLVTDGLPGLALAGEKAEGDVMKRPPRMTGESLFAGGIAYHIVWVGILMAGVTLGTQALSMHYNFHWQTMVFSVLSFAQLGHVLAIRSEKEFLYQQGLFSNPRLLAAVLLTFFLQLAVIYLPAANEIFHTQPLTFSELIICIGVSAIVFHAVELEKWIRRRR